MQKDAKRARRFGKGGETSKLSPHGLLSYSQSSSNRRISPVEEKETSHFAAARGLTSLMNAAAAL